MTEHQPDLGSGFEADDVKRAAKGFAGGTGIAGSKERLREEDSLAVAAMKAAREQGDHLRELAHERREEMRELIREQPLAAVGATFAGGLILGLLLARRR